MKAPFDSWLHSILVFVISLLIAAPLYSQAPESEESEVMDAQAPAEMPTAAPDLPQFKDERTQLLQTLTKDVIPNLPAKDVERLQRSVQRRGSYRAEWAQGADTLLVANSPVAELIIYKFSLYKNPLLNERLLHTLGQFESLRFPRASLAFAEVLGTDTSSKVKVLKLMAKALNQDAALGPDALAVVTSSWGSSIPVEERLAFAAKSCGAWKRGTPQAAEVFSHWYSEAQSFWARSFAVEIATCLKGI